MNKPGMLIVYSGPSGVGKGTILTPYLQSHPNTVLSVSATTRAPRPGEVDGVHYHFVTREHFEELVSGGGLLEYAQYSGNYYGTPREPVERLIAQGRDVVLEIELKGARQVRESFPDAVFVFVMPPSYEELKKRLCGRGTEPPQTVCLRMEAAIEEIAHAGEYDYILINDNVESACETLAAIITAAKCQSKRMIEYVRKAGKCQ